MLNWFARILLVSSSLAPTALGFAALNWSADRKLFWVFAAVAGALLLSLLAVLKHATRAGEREVLHCKEARIANKEAVGTFIALALPLLGGVEQIPRPLAVVAFAPMIYCFLLRSDLVQSNPLLVILGYTMHEVVNAFGKTTALITRQRAITPGTFLGVRLSPEVWLDLGGRVS